MKELFIYILEVIVCSGVMLGAYILLLERRVPFIVCRRYLLGINIFAMLIPLIKIPVWVAETTEITGIISVGELPFQAEIIATPTMDPLSIIGIVYLIGTMIMIAIVVRQTLRIRRLDREAQISDNGKIRIARTSSQISSFSFSDTIYIGNNVCDDELGAIIAHETSHIIHKHLNERAQMEAIKVFCWWNPFVWIVSSKLIEVQEFEADADVIRQGYNIQTYIHIIFKQLFGYSPDITSGLRNSLTKKRFTMMTTNKKSRYALLRIAGTVPIVAALFVAFSFTTKAAEAPDANSIVQQNAVTITPSDDDTPFLIVDVMPTFQNGDVSVFREWVNKQMKYPVEALEKDISGRVICSFIVEKDGSISSLKIIQSPDESLSKEVKRTINTSPKWTPGSQNGQVARVQHTLSVDFRSTKTQ